MNPTRQDTVFGRSAAGSVALCLSIASMAAVEPAHAHGPLFSPAPETIWKGGVELTAGYHLERATGAGEEEREREVFLEAEYGVTADWEIGAELPYAWNEEDGLSAEGIGDITLGTKYQFWKRDLPGAQYKAAAFLRTKLPSGDDHSLPRIGTGSTDVIGGLATGYEGRRWYWFASGVYRVNTQGEGGLEKGDEQFLNAVGGVRPVLGGYLEPDTVLMLELNWERAGRDEQNGAEVRNSGGWELFLSPVLWWTYRQVAIRGGIQIPVADGLNGPQPDSDYRGLVEFVYHF